MGIVSFLAEKLSRVKNIGKPKNSIFEYSFTTLSGKEVKLSDFKDDNLLIVNTASKCGFTYQYEELQRLHEQYGNKVKVLGFPANNFLWQEPGTDNDIAEFCQINYGVSFPMSQKVSVKGKAKHPIFQWLTGMTGKEPSWNFCKYLVKKNGEVIFYPSKVSPLDTSIVSKLD